MKPDLLLFDLDGTLADTADDIADSLLSVLDAAGRPPLPRADIVAAIGNGVRRLVERTTPPPHEEIVARFMTVYASRCLQRTRLYPGVLETLGRLPGRKVILTNKPADLSHTIVRGLAIAGFFERIYGGDSLPARKPDREVVRAILAETGARRPVLIGDSGVDVQTARNAGIPVIVVTYGYHKPGDLDAADARVDRFEKLAVCIETFP
ncbi:MAG: HAD-IA family hydrolase [Planctomycetes bacterium]|nr:HAD-IA family hydrolase [Planctomycetota bacterium]